MQPSLGTVWLSISIAMACSLGLAEVSREKAEGLETPLRSGQFPPEGEWLNIIAGHSGQCLEVDQGSLDDGANIQQGECLGETQTNQFWKLRSEDVDGETWFRIIARHSDKCFQVAAGASTIWQWTCLDPPEENQLWKLEPDQLQGVPWFRMVAKHTGQCADVVSGEPGADVGLYPCHGLPHQLFQFRQAGTLTEKTGGLKGYFSFWASPPEGYGHGVSFYSSVWSLLEKPLANFQVGLPSSWIIPDNQDFQEALCPPGTFAADNWSEERGPYYRDVFQTIEGGTGFWVVTQSKQTNPKFRMNGTPDCYNSQISSPGWSFSQPEALAGDKMGIAQLSNHLLIPPDGLTFKAGLNGELFGVSWMALPLTSADATGAQTAAGRPRKQTGEAPGSTVATGDFSWTLFLNTSNCKGPVAFWIPETWSRLSRSYPTISGRGLDARTGLMGSGGMEFNTIPYFEGVDNSGVRFTRIPRLTFPVDGQGNTVLMQDVRVYSSGALFDPVKSWLEGFGYASGTFDLQESVIPDSSASPISLRQGPDDLPLSGLDSVVETSIAGNGSFALKWNNPATQGVFPEYFKQVSTNSGEGTGNQMIVVAASEVPAETQLASQNFAPGLEGQPYTSGDNVWDEPGPALGPFMLKLADGTRLVYSWYRFVDQPALQHLNLSDTERNRLQSVAEQIHSSWAITGSYMPEPSGGSLATLDESLLVTPPSGLEIGYVPIVTGQDMSQLPLWLYAAGDPLGSGTHFDGLALTNLSDSQASLDLEILTSSVATASAEKDSPQGNDRVSLALQAGEQTARLRTDLFEHDPSQPAWIEVTGDTSRIGTFFQFGTNTLSQLDGGVAIKQASPDFVLTRVHAGPQAFRGVPATTRVSILNPNPDPVVVELTYQPAAGDGGLQGASVVVRGIPGRSFLDEPVVDLLGTGSPAVPQGAQISGGIISGKVTQGGGVVAFELIQLTDHSTVLGLNAATGSSTGRAYSAQLASLPGVLFTSVNVVNRSNLQRNVTLRAVGEDGNDKGTPVEFVLAPGEQLTEDAGVLFGSGTAGQGQVQTESFVGSMIMEADGEGVVGDVIFGDSQNFAYAAALPLQTRTFTEAVFNQVANVAGFFTGLAFFYPGSSQGNSTQGAVDDAEVTIQVFRPSGEMVGEGILALRPGERISQLVEQLVGEIELAGGYVRVFSNHGIIGQMLFGVVGPGGIQLFSAVPPTVVQ